MSIVRIGLGETKNFAEGYDAIFGKKAATTKPSAAKAEEKPSDEAADATKKKKPAKAK